MWVVAAIVLTPTYRTHVRHLAYLGLILVWLALGQVVWRSAYNSAWGGYLGSYGLLWILLAVLLLEWVSWWQERARSAPRTSDA
jgi:hypothetical protein